MFLFTDTVTKNMILLSTYYVESTKHCLSALHRPFHSLLRRAPCLELSVTEEMSDCASQETWQLLETFLVVKTGLGGEEIMLPAPQEWSSTVPSALDSPGEQRIIWPQKFQG